MAPRAPRSATAADCAALTELCLRSKASNGYDDAFMAACRDELTVTPHRLAATHVLAIDGPDGPVACAGLGPTDNPKIGEVTLFFTDPDHQRAGLGTALWQGLLGVARGRGLISLTLDADPNAVPFYVRLGFAVTGETPSGSIPGRTLPVMTRPVG